MKEKTFLVGLFFLGAMAVNLPILGIKAYFLKEEKEAKAQFPFQQQIAWQDEIDEKVLGETEFSNEPACDVQDRSDINCSGKVDLSDFAYWLQYYKLSLTPTPTGEPGCTSNDDCYWCGEACMKRTGGTITSCGSPPEGTECQCISGGCSLKPISPTPTPQACIDEGSVASMSQNCCEPFQKVVNSSMINGNCVNPEQLNYRCSKCGDGTCGSGENYCNCPADCRTDEEETL